MLLTPLSRNLLALCALLFLSSSALAYDVKTYVLVTGGVSKIEFEREGYDVIDANSEAYELTGGLDLSDRWSIEMSFTDLGDYHIVQVPQQAPGFFGNQDEANLHAFRFNVVFYLLGGTQGSQRMGFNAFVRGGLATVASLDIFSDVGDELEGIKFSYGAGIEYAFDRTTAMRAQIQGYADDIGFASVSIMWRWGRDRGS